MKANYTQRLQQTDAIQYDGDNAAEIVEEFGGSINEDGAPVVDVYGVGSATTIRLGNYIYWSDGVAPEPRMLDRDTFGLYWRPTV